MKFTTSDWKTETQGLRNELSKQGVELVFKGNEIKTNGNTITLPELPDDVPLSIEELYKLRGYLDHEAAHIVDTDWVDFKIWRDAHEGKPEEVIMEKHQMFNILEDTRIEREASRRYSGSRKHFVESAKELELKCDENEFFEKLTGISQRVRKDEYGLEWTEGTKEIYDKHSEVVEKVVEKFNKCQSTQDILDLVNEYYEEHGSDPENQPTQEDYDKAREDQQEEQQELEGEGEKDSEGTRKDQEAQAQARGEVKNTDDPNAEQPMDSDDGQEELVESLLKRPDISDSPPCSLPNYTKDDKILLPVSEYSSNMFPGERGYGYRKVVSNLGLSLNTAKNLFRRALLSKDKRGWETGRETGRLDAKRYSLAVTGAPNVRKVREETEDYDTAVHILLDCSGSMSGRKIRTAFACMVTLVECLKGTPVKVAISGHTTGNRDYGKYFRQEALIMPLFKDYDQPLPSSIKDIEQIGRLHLRNNADLCALREALKNISKRPEKRKVLVVISDGYPAFDSAADWYELETTCRLRMLALQKHYAKYYNVETFGIGIEADHVTEYYPEGYPIEDIDEFISKTLKILAKKLLTNQK